MPPFDPVTPLKGLLVLLLVFLPIEFLAGRWLALGRAGAATDLWHYGVGYGLGRGVTDALVLLLPPTETAIARWPLGVQVVVALLLGDLMYYQLHRLLHRVPWLWQFHAIHHSSPHVDWLATVRLHPLEVVLTKIVQMGPLYLLGFSQAALVTYTLVAAAFAFGIHARVPWRFPLLRWLVATPEFHHWHHAREPRRNQQNLAAQFPLWDWLGGTLYLPRGDRPQRYGIGLPVPEGYVAQVWFPFHRLGLGKGKRTH